MTTTPKTARPKKTETVEARQPKNPRNAAYSNAERRLRDLYPEDFRRLHKEETEKLGLEYKPQMTAEERAEALRLERIAKARKKLEEAQAVIAALGGDAASDDTPLAVTDEGPAF